MEHWDASVVHLRPGPDSNWGFEVTRKILDTKRGKGPQIVNVEGWACFTSDARRLVAEDVAEGVVEVLEVEVVPARDLDKGSFNGSVDFELRWNPKMEYWAGPGEDCMDGVVRRSRSNREGWVQRY